MLDIHIIKKLHTSIGLADMNISLSIQQGEITGIQGESGAGKTTLLRIIAGLTDVDNGHIKVEDTYWLNTEKKLFVPPQKRNIGFVFQDYALFPNMTVEENLQFAVGTKAKESKIVIEELLEFMELQNLRKKNTHQLSGGQKQRTAIARALVRKPKLLLLDEPFSSLDNETRSKMQDLILSVHKKYNLTTLIVSHHLPDIFKMSNTVVVIKNGQIQKQGTPIDILPDKKISGKFQFMGEILNIRQEDFIYIISVLIGNNIIQVVATEKEAVGLSAGDSVIISSKAFNPIIVKSK